MHAALGLKCVAGLALQTGLDKLHVPYSYGWSIILLTLLVKTALFPITRKQVSFREESLMTGLLSTGLIPHMAV